MMDSNVTWQQIREQWSTKPILLGLERVQAVRLALGIAAAPPVVITVGGTNGKGSTCAMLESILLRAGYKVGCYTSPDFLSFLERVRVGGEPASDVAMTRAFTSVTAHGAADCLTQFELDTMAALHMFDAQQLDVWILEVGLGGRLDAVNIIDADVAIVTSVDLDHTDYLGDTREKIGFEKAGIFRTGRAAICSDPAPPQSLIDHALEIGADLWLLGRDFNYAGDQQQWNYGGREQRRNALAYPSLRGANQLLNASAVLAALEVLRLRLPVGAQEVRSGLVMVDLPGRFQVLPGRPNVILDVAHNPHAAATLAHSLGNMGFYPYTYAVFGAMADKDIDGIIVLLKEHVDHWCVTTLPSPRSATASAIEARLLAAGVQPSSTPGSECSIQTFDDPTAAFTNAMKRAGESDRIVVFGSFLTVAAVLANRSA
jgi:dihydrofolate synthase/folylpolyglutamate synthase